MAVWDRLLTAVVVICESYAASYIGGILAVL